jgi:hypothetical protein
MNLPSFSLPTNPTTRKALAIGLVFLVGLALGRYSLPAKVVVKTEVKTVEKVVQDTTKNEKKNTTTVVTETKKPDGTDITTTEIVDKDQIISNTDTTTNTSTDSTSSKTTTYDTGSLSVAGLAGVQFGGGNAVTYGLHVQKKLLGPVNIGVFGFTDKLFGASIGLRF